MLDIQFLKNIEILSSLTDAELTTLLPYLKESNYRKKTRVIKQGESGTTFYIVKNGFVHVLRGTESDVFLATIGPGETFGEAALFHDTKRIANIDTDEKCDLLSISKVDFEKYLKTHPLSASKILIKLLKHIFMRLEKTSHELQFQRSGNLNQDAIDDIIARI